MENGTVFMLTMPNSVEVKTLVLRNINNTIIENFSTKECYETLLCYGQNRLFTVEFRTVIIDTTRVTEAGDVIPDSERIVHDPKILDIICDYCIMPELDKELTKY